MDGVLMGIVGVMAMVVGALGAHLSLRYAKEWPAVSFIAGLSALTLAGGGYLLLFVAWAVWGWKV